MYILNLELCSHVRTQYRSQFMIGALTLKSTFLVSLHPFYRHLSSCYEEVFLSSIFFWMIYLNIYVYKFALQPRVLIVSVSYLITSNNMFYKSARPTYYAIYEPPRYPQLVTLLLFLIKWNNFCIFLSLLQFEQYACQSVQVKIPSLTHI